MESPQPNQDSPKRDLRTRLMWFYVFFAGCMFIVAMLSARVMTERLKTEANTAVLRQAQTHIQQLGTTTPPAINSTTTLYMLDSTGEIREIVNPVAQPSSLIWRDWKTAVFEQAKTSNEGTFTSTDPNGTTWLFAFAPDEATGQIIVLQQPTAIAYSAIPILNQVWIIAFIMFMAGGIFSWILVTRMFVRPLEQLGEYSGIIRWRGQIRPDEKEQLDKLAQREDQFGDLTRSMMVMEQDINQRFLQLSTLLETSRVVAASLEEKEVLNNILDQLQNLFPVESCAIVALNKRADVFRIRFSRGLSEEYVEKLRIAPSEPNSPSMRALRNQEPIQVANTETDLVFSTFRPRAREEGYRSILAVPLQTTHAPPAVLLLYKTEPYRYSYTELELASSFAHHASIAMENAALFALTDERLQEQTRRLEAIVDSLEDGLILEGEDGRVLYCNHQASTWLHISRRDARQQTGTMLFDRILNTTTNPNEAQQKYKTAVTKQGPRSFDLMQTVHNGRDRDLRIHLFDVTDGNGEMLGRGQLWQDITRDKELDRMKSALLSTVSHELRTPLATIKGYASTLLANDVEWDAATQREFLHTINDETDRLATLVKKLLDMSRIEAGMLDIQTEIYSLNDLVNEVLHSFKPAQNGRFHPTLAADLPPIPMDISRISTVIRNFVENAVKYSPTEQPIELTTSHENGRVTLTVRDYGRGIPKDVQDKIFDRFFRADNRLARQVGGTGLGLAICKGFVEAHNGHVWVQAAQPGATFGFTLPIHRESLE